MHGNDLRRDFLLELELLDPQSASLGRSPMMSVDFEPALEAARLEVLRRTGSVPAAYSGATQFSVEPRWTEPPFLDGFVVKALLENGRAIEHTVSRRYFYPEAKTLAARFVEEGKLSEGQRYVSVAAAYGRTAKANGDVAPARAFSLKSAPPDLHVVDAPLAAFAGGADHPVDPIDPLPVFVPGAVVEQVVELGREATNRELETGSLLLGRLHRNPADGRLFLAVTAQLPVQAEQGPTRLGFTDRTWATARSALALRKQDAEFVVGFFHNHPVRTVFACKSCPAERQRVCPLSRPFFSADDVGVMRTAFHRSMQIGLLVTDVGWREPMVDAFGWDCDGLVARRDFHIVGPCRANCRAAEAGTDVTENRQGEVCETEEDNSSSSTDS